MYYQQPTYREHSPRKGRMTSSMQKEEDWTLWTTLVDSKSVWIVKDKTSMFLLTKVFHYLIIVIPLETYMQNCRLPNVRDISRLFWDTNPPLFEAWSLCDHFVQWKKKKFPLPSWAHNPWILEMKLVQLTWLMKPSPGPLRQYISFKNLILNPFSMH